MTTASTADEAVKVVLGIARLGEADLAGWWSTHGLDRVGGYILARSFRRTWRPAALELDVASAARRHEDATAGRRAALHMFSDELPFRRWTTSWLAEQKTAAEPSVLFDELGAWDLDTARSTIANWAGSPPRTEVVGDGLLLGTLARADVDDSDAIGSAARLLAATYLAIDEQFRVPYFAIYEVATPRTVAGEAMCVPAARAIAASPQVPVAASLRPSSSSKENQLTVIDTLRQALSDEASAGRAAGVEVRQDLAAPYGQPVMPPSYEAPLEIHSRHLDGKVRAVIELDSIGSSANRVEEGLLEEYRAGRYPLPVSSMTLEAGNGQTFTISTLEAPHRIFDAWIRLATEAGSDVAFEVTERGQELSLAHAGALDPILETSSHDLLFGVWDSHRSGPGGQVRIARSFTSTVIGLDPEEIITTAARRDPLNLGEAKDVKAPKGMKLSKQGLSSIPPQRRRPGVSISEARFIGFLSFAALRRLRFERYDNADVRVLLAALCLYGLRLRETAGWHLRSECDLIPTSDMRFELLRTGGEQREQLSLALDDTRALLAEAVDRAGVKDRSVHLVGGPHLTPLVERALDADRVSGNR